MRDEDWGHIELRLQHKHHASSLQRRARVSPRRLLSGTSSHLQTVGGGRRQVRPGERANVPVGFLRAPPRLLLLLRKPSKAAAVAQEVQEPHRNPDSHQPRASWSSSVDPMQRFCTRTSCSPVIFSLFLSHPELLCCGFRRCSFSGRPETRRQRPDCRGMVFALQDVGSGCAAPLLRCRCSRAFPPRSCRAYR